MSESEKRELPLCHGNACSRCGKCLDWRYDGDFDRDCERFNRRESNEISNKNRWHRRPNGPIVTLAKIRTFIEQYQTDFGICECLSFRVQQQIGYLQAWKAHLLRTVHQDQARINILDNLDYETVTIHVDWAMKWFPTKYRESKKDHFTKTGLSWHIAFVVRNNSSSSFSNSFDTSFDSQASAHKYGPDENKYEHRVFCHVFDQCVQNAKTVVSIIRYIFLCLQQTSPNIKYINLRSDNAGYYHGTEALLSVVQLSKETGI
ncbi:unnamed protein product [Adineta steineri]|uniref:Uncharacterized protein n=1 Tax=Adineta steineri TaxID=433720 RepID=A0A815REJ7_9BILA|nr:unnamed protein product [Adineta steineri]CAF1636728.1 unnamed protein product [Adineta steineri]